jgi:hypothetical protein
MTKNKLMLLAIVAASILAPAAVNADRLISIQIGDRPFYNHGATYWDGDYEMVWVPGHMSRFGHHWIHGTYVRGEHRRHDLNRRHDVRNDNYRDNDRRDDRQ